MISVTYGELTEPVTRVVDSSYERHREVNGPFTLSFTSVEDGESNPGHFLLHEEALVEEDGHAYRVKQLSQTGKRKSITAIHQYFDILNGIQKHEIFGGSKTLQEFASWVFEGTPITVEVRGITERRLISNFGQASGPELMEILLQTFECERDIQPGLRLVFEREIGPDNDEQFRYGTDVITHSYSVDTTNLKTRITGYGGNNLVVTYTSPNAPLFPHAGEAEPVRDERYLLADSMIERLKQELDDVPNVAIEVESLKATERELGERIWLILDNIGIRMQSRILAKTDKRPAYRSTAVVGNRVPKTQTDLLTETDVKIDEKIDDVNAVIEERARQSETRFEQTNEAITATAEALEKYTDDRYGEVTREMEAQWQVAAEGITGAVTEAKGYTDSREKIIMDALGAAENRWEEDLSSIGAQVTNLDGSVSTIVDELGTLDSDLETLRGDIVTITENYDSQFTQMSNRITLEVSGSIEYAETQAGVAQANAEKYASDLVSPLAADLSTLQGSVTDLDTYIDGAFSDKMVDLTERKAIGQLINDADAHKANVDGQYTTLYNDPGLPSFSKTYLSDAKAAFDRAYTDLVTRIQGVIRDGFAFPNEASEIEVLFEAFRGAYAEMTKQLQDASAELSAKFASDAKAEAIKYTDDELVTVRSEATSDFNVLAGRINAKADSTTVTNLGTRTYNLEQDMNAIEGEISSTVKSTDFTGQTMISKISQTSSLYKIDAKNIQMSGITEVAGRLQVGNASNPATKLEFYNGGYYQPYISIGKGVYGSGMDIFASDIHIDAADHLYLGNSATDEVHAYGEWNWANATHKNLTAVAVLA